MNASTFLMFAGEARNALELYQQSFSNLEVASVTEHQLTDGSSGIQQAKLVLAGHSLVLNDSSVEMDFGFTPATSIFIDFDSAEEMEAAFASLSEGGEILMPVADYGFSEKFGWLRDPFGVSWQLNLP